MSGLGPRQNWMCDRIVETFAPKLTQRDAIAFMRKSDTQMRIKHFLGAISSPGLFVFYQPVLDAEGNEPAENAPMRLLITQGDEERLASRCCYFVRNQNSPVDVTAYSDATVLYGELHASPLASLETQLGVFFRPIFDNFKAWGKADEPQQEEFMSCVDKFETMVGVALKQIGDGIELRKPNMAKFNADPARAVQQCKTNPALHKHFTGLLAEWCEVIEKTLAEETKVIICDITTDDLQAELEHWRHRMQHLISIIEQLKTRECRAVVGCLSSIGEDDAHPEYDASAAAMRRWQDTDTRLTHSASEAKDNVKYLFTLERYVPALYRGTPHDLVEVLPAMMNSVKMVHTVARHYSTHDRMTKLFAKVTNTMIRNCKRFVAGDDPLKKQLWDYDALVIIERLEACQALNKAYKACYAQVKAKLATMPRGKQFDFDEGLVFGKFDLFYNRVTKLIDMFGTVAQFTSLSEQKIEGMEGMAVAFQTVFRAFQRQRHDLLDFQNNRFDRDYLDFKKQVTDLEGLLQDFIDKSFEKFFHSIERSLSLFAKFQALLQRDSLRSDLDSKLVMIFQNYGKELEDVMVQYERDKHSPPIPRNLPPVAGNISWSRHLLKRIEEPMKRFEKNEKVLMSNDARKTVKLYNKVAKMLVAFEYLWYQAWVQSLPNATAGLQATLIIRHPDDRKLHVNFDPEIMRLIYEAKCLHRMSVEIPPLASKVLMQEFRFKGYYNSLQQLLTEYEEDVVANVMPICKNMLQPHLKDMEMQLMPGMVNMIWTSMNIDEYMRTITEGLQRLHDLCNGIKDVVEHRVERGLKIISRTTIVDLPKAEPFSLDEFVDRQQEFISMHGKKLQQKNLEIEKAVHDVMDRICSHPLHDSIEPVSQNDVEKFHEHYNHLMYRALLYCLKKSLFAIKERVCAKGGLHTIAKQRPFFEVDVQLVVNAVNLSPSLDQIQYSINEAAKSVLTCSKTLWDWGQLDIPEEQRKHFFDRITQDVEIVRVCLLLTGSIQGTRNSTADFLDTFRQYDWVWKDDQHTTYKAFMKNRKLTDFTTIEGKLISFKELQQDIKEITAFRNVGALTLNTKNIKQQLISELDEWKIVYSENLRLSAKIQMDDIFEYVRLTTGKINREVNDLESLMFVMNMLKEVRDKESQMDMEIKPIIELYTLLEDFLPEGYVQQEELDQKVVIRNNWRKLVSQCETITSDLSREQSIYRNKLISDVRAFVIDVEDFRQDYLSNGPMVQGVKPMDAVERLNRFQEEYNIRERKEGVYQSAEELFCFPITEYPLLGLTKKELGLSDKLFSLYVDVINTMEEWDSIQWTSVQDNIDDMTDKVNAFALRCKRMPVRLREYESYTVLKKTIEDFQNVLPLLQELSKESIKPRHWDEVMEITGAEFDFESPEFTLKILMEAKIVEFFDDISELTDGADKQMKIEEQLKEVAEKWELEAFMFQEWKDRKVPVLKTVGPVVEELEDAEMILQTLLTMRHVAPFREEAAALLGSLSDTSETLERWTKVQQMWSSLEWVFTGGDIAKQMPLEAKKFQKIDKDWAKLMAKARETELVIECCANEVLKNSLPSMYAELEKCQKSLEGYLEQKRNKFPRFYFVSNPGLLLILSSGTNPESMNAHYEKIFDSIYQVVHDKKNKEVITTILAPGGTGAEVVPFSQPVKAVGNLEDWLCTLLYQQQVTMKDICRNCALDIQIAGADVKSLRGFVDGFIAQFALLGIQMLWTSDCQLALDRCKVKKTSMKEGNNKCMQVLMELSSWCLQDLGAKPNRRKIETLVTIQVHHRDVINDLYVLFRQKKIHDGNDFEWLKQARFFWHTEGSDEVNSDGTSLISITDIDFNNSYEYLGSKERLVVTPLTDRCYICIAQALGMNFGSAPAGPAGTGKTETTKDMGRTLGIWVVVTNCGTEMSYKDCGKIFKGLCQSGLWGCFDEVNRIQLPVLSVVAQQVGAILSGRKAGVHEILFPGEEHKTVLIHSVGVFFTMNPGYAGRQELPENLKALFRGVVMIVPDFEIIIKVKLCSVGYSEFTMLAKKFHVLYKTNKEQLSAQKHYDWGLRNILSVLRTGGKTKRNELDAPESVLLYRTLRDMNLSKLVAQDVPLFLSLLADLFPALSPPAKGSYPEVEVEIKKVVDESGLIHFDSWILKVIQLYETTLVRHGIMLVGPSQGGKSEIYNVLAKALTITMGIPHKIQRMNPKAIRAAEMYGEIDPLSQEWNTGVFAAIWAKANNRLNKWNTWISMDGPIDAIWIEDLNSVLDDNKLLTLANGDRMPMTDNVKLTFEVEMLINASPATVSRAGIIFVSDVDLDWKPVITSWLHTRPDEQQQILDPLVEQYLGSNSPVDVGHLINFIIRNTSQVLSVSRVGMVKRFFTLLTGLLDGEGAVNLSLDPEDMVDQIEKLVLYCLTWSIGGLLEQDDRVKFSEYLSSVCTTSNFPECEEKLTIYEYMVDPSTMQWVLWKPPVWEYPKGEKLDFSSLLVPTMDSTRALYILEHVHKQKKAVLSVGGPGTAKTSTNYVFLHGLDSQTMMYKVVNFSSATTPFMAQETVENQLDKRGGKNFGPPNAMKMTFFLDDLSMPLVNNWGDQPTLEAVRLVVEFNYFTFLDKDKRGDFKICEDLQYIAAMGHPGGGRNDIPNRLKSKFYIFNLVLPSLISINDIYGQMLDGRFTAKQGYNEDALNLVSKMTEVTIKLWNRIRVKMLPTPAKFHYIFNMRDLSRVFQGVLFTPHRTILDGGGIMAKEGKKSTLNGKEYRSAPKAQDVMMLALWKHECLRAFCDKLTNNDDKHWCADTIENLITEYYGDDLHEKVFEPVHMLSCLREDIYDEEGVFEDYAPKVYEVGGSMEHVRDRVTMFNHKYNEEFPTMKLELVLFNDALEHLLRISRLIEMPRGSGLLVGVGGSGKQSLTRIAAYLSNAFCFQITLTKSYNTNALLEDVRTMYRSAGHQRKPTVFLFTEAEIKEEIFLETINSILMTGEVSGLFAKDEMMAMTADLHHAFVHERPELEENSINLNAFFIDCARDNLHLFMCMSPLNPMFPVRARKFPGVISAPTIDWFLPWPEEALVAVSRGFIGGFKLDASQEVKENLMLHMGNVHSIVTQVCEEYFEAMRRKVYQTPKSYLSFIQVYRSLYTLKLKEVKVKEERVNLGLDKLVGGARDVEAMKVVLAQEQVKLEKATTETNKMLSELEINAAAAQKEAKEVDGIRTKCEADAKRIAGEKSACQADLAKAQPFVDEAETAIDSIKPAHINEIKKLPKPSDIIKLVFDGVLILFKGTLNPVKKDTLIIAKQEVDFFESSFVPHAQLLMGDTNFLKHVQDFGANEKDLINEETIEFMCPYMDLDNFTPAVAKNASAAAEGLCTWVRAMKFYHEASKIVKPKLEALGIAEAQMETANKALAAAEKRLQACKDTLQNLKNAFETQMAEKKRIEDGAQALANKMQQASDLINGLSGERIRWTEDSNNFASLKQRLVGDCAVAAAFVSYCGPFNQEFRGMLISKKFYKDCVARNVPATPDIDIISFLVDIGTIGDWNMEGLPTDPLSIQNGILVTQATRFPMLIDPQAQAIGWILEREKARLPPYGATTINHPKLKDQLEFCMGEGLALVIAGVEEVVDPLLDPVLNKEIIVKGRSMSINVGDKNMDYNPSFSMFFITRLPNPHFSPELQSKTTVVDFTVTQKGLEEQLLGKVISVEQHALEDQLNQVLADVNQNTKALLQLDSDLLNRLTSNSGNLLEDDELIGVLANTKQKAAEVQDKLIAADETKKSINEKRETFRPVATRGSVLYFSIVEMSLVNCMYQTSLEQFLHLFMGSMQTSEKAALASQRVTNIIGEMTYTTYRYINRGLYEPDKLLFVLLFTLKVLVTAGLLPASDVQLFLRAGAALDINSVRKKPFKWIGEEAWLNVVQLSMSNSFFKNLPNEMTSNDLMWQRWYEDNEPESMAIPDYEQRLSDNATIGPFLKLLLLRSLRVDRTNLMCKQFVANTKEVGERYVEPVTDTMEMIYDSSEPEIPTIFLLSPGADPTEALETLARKRKVPPPSNVSLGQGQEPVAIRAMNNAAINGGSWVILQNCELGLPLMVQMEDLMTKLVKEENFRLFLSCMPSNEFPLALLQMSTKVTNEPPAGLRAGLMRSMIVSVDQDRLERIETVQWRQLIFLTCMMHSVVQERRKFGPLGWCIPYEFNTGDLEASMKFLERHLYNGPISWPTAQYNICECQYGSRINDAMDRRLCDLYVSKYISAEACKEGFTLNPARPLQRMPGDFEYSIPQFEQITEFREFCATLPELDSPEVFGLHPNADLTFRVKQANNLLTQMSESQPKGGGGGGGISPAEVAFEKATELMERLPIDYNEDEYKAQVQKLGGLTIPLNIFLFQEVQRLQNVIAKVRFTVKNLRMAIQGEVVMTDELQNALLSFYEAKAPTRWVNTVAGDIFSWVSPSLGVWFSSLLSRDEQNRLWLSTTRPNSFWMTGFFNPQGLLTAMKQEVTRKHKGESWALDDVVYHTDVTHHIDSAHVKQAPPEGLFVHGLFLDGAAWSRHDGHLVEQEPKKLFTSLPVLLVSANTKSEQAKVNRSMFGAVGPYECPVYKYPRRTDLFYVLHVNLRATAEKEPSFWGLRGTALLCNSA